MPECGTYLGIRGKKKKKIRRGQHDVAFGNILKTRGSLKEEGLIIDGVREEQTTHTYQKSINHQT